MSSLCPALAESPTTASPGAPVLIGHSAAMTAVIAAATRVAASTAAVLIEGETGTGKELVARLIHARSRRSRSPFVSHNAGATPDTLIESELFGHARGSFTGAVRDHRGLFAAADGGTLFLDEIADVSPLMQAKLLRVLQEGEFRRVGETHSRHLDARLIAATNRPLEGEVSAGRFRVDLFYRLHVVKITLPPLRERSADIPALAAHFAARFALSEGSPPITLTPPASFALRRYGWPGNVRELENEIRRLTALHAGEEVTVRKLSDRVRSALVSGGSIAESPRGRSLASRVEALERRLIAEGLVRFAGNKTRVARDLGLSRQGLAKKMRRYGLRWVIPAASSEIGPDELHAEELRAGELDPLALAAVKAP